MYLDGKKLCGILTEASGSFEADAVNSVCVGVGINVHTRQFPAELEGLACSLWPCAASRNRLAAEIAGRMLVFCERLERREFMPEYRERSMVLGRQIRYEKDGAQRSALAVGITDGGALIARLPDGREETLFSGEVRLLSR